MRRGQQWKASHSDTPLIGRIYAFRVRRSRIPPYIDASHWSSASTLTPKVFGITNKLLLSEDDGETCLRESISESKCQLRVVSVETCRDAKPLFGRNSTETSSAMRGSSKEISETLQKKAKQGIGMIRAVKWKITIFSCKSVEY